jgi:hydroxymethylpyrimidine ABC superfamily ATP binding cassette transporter, membrane protein
LFHWRLFARAVLPYIAASQAVPAIAVAPLLVVWIGYGTVPTVVLCVLMVFFPITVSVLLGLRSLDTDIIDAARLDGAHGPSMVAYMELPLALPAILSGLRTGFTLSVTGAVIGEMTMGGKGLGMVLASQRQSVDTAGLFSTIAVLCIMATSIHWCLQELERRSRVVDSLRGRRAT